MAGPLAVVLAAGRGTRMKSDLPKVLFPVLGRPMIHWVLDALQAAGCQRSIVVVGYHEQDFLYALGLAPVGVHEWFGGHPFATWEWAEPARLALGAQPQVQRGFEIDLEWVYQQQPDLCLCREICGCHWPSRAGAPSVAE